MTLREEYVKAVIQGLCANPNFDYNDRDFRASIILTAVNMANDLVSIVNATKSQDPAY